MSRIAKPIVLAGLVALLPAGAALAEVPLAPAKPSLVTSSALVDSYVWHASAPDPERLNLARQIVAIAIPPDQAKAFVEGLVANSTHSSIEIRLGTTPDDPGGVAIKTDYVNTVADGV